MAADAHLNHLKRSSDISKSPIVGDLPAPLRHELETQFSKDFSDVRVHQGHEATLVGAKAYTSGNDIFFAPGEYQPHTENGKQLISNEVQTIAHEASHVVQQ